jgi:hypothetical protein
LLVAVQAVRGLVELVVLVVEALAALEQAQGFL